MFFMSIAITNGNLFSVVLDNLRDLIVLFLLLRSVLQKAIKKFQSNSTYRSIDFSTWVDGSGVNH